MVMYLLIFIPKLNNFSTEIRNLLVLQYDVFCIVENGISG